VVAGYKDFMILNNLSFTARTGSITLLIGPNGAGKSTVLKTLFGLLKPRQGSIRSNGDDVTGADAERPCWRVASPSCRKGATCLANLSVYENLELGGITLGMKTTHERIPEVLDFFRASRSACTRALPPCRAVSRSSWRSAARCCCRPKVLLIDEPSIGLVAT
jgi:branched-chain amino acid transport system ATP-binding protein